MPLKTSKYIWHDGKMVPWAEATVHVLSHALHYGSSVFEGIRVYKTPAGAMGFRLTDHMRRLYHSAKIYRMKVPFALDTLVTACREVVSENGLLNGAYIRPLVFRGYGEMGVAGNVEQPANVSIAAWEWGSYLGEGALDQGVDVCVSSWQRVAPNTVPALAKAGGNYLSSALVTLEARRLGFAEGLALNTAGFVSEGAGENLFIVKGGVIYTPDLSAGALNGITRNTVFAICADLGIKIVEKRITRDEVYISDEAFFTGTAAEVTPIREYDRVTLGAGERGPLTTKIQAAFFDIVNGRNPKYAEWLTLV
jgi:branched-chain amino acid aminotransferase